jgi:intracellular multiplication protein IcmJ
MPKSITLNVSLYNYSQFSGRKSKPAFRKLAKQIFERDQYCCQFCGFQAKEFQEIVNADHNYENNQLENLVTACCFCTQCFFLESIGEGGYGGGTLIYLPEIEQHELNSIAHVLFCAIINETHYKDSAQSIYRTFRMRAQFIEKALGEGTSHPAAFGQLFLDYQSSQKNTDALAIFKNIRLLPSRSRFTRQIRRWAESALGNMEKT